MLGAHFGKGFTKLRITGLGAWATALDLTVPPLAKAVAGVIRRSREQQGLSQNQLAERSGVSRPMIHAIEHDQYVPSIRTLARLAVGLGMPYDQLNARAVRWLSRQPAPCRACQYSCMAHGKLPCLNRQRGCTRPTG